MNSLVCSVVGLLVVVASIVVVMSSFVGSFVVSLMGSMLELLVVGSLGFWYTVVMDCIISMLERILLGIARESQEDCNV